MADLATVFGWAPEAMDALEPEELMRWRKLAEARATPQR